MWESEKCKLNFFSNYLNIVMLLFKFKKVLSRKKICPRNREYAFENEFTWDFDVLDIE